MSTVDWNFNSIRMRCYSKIACQSIHIFFQVYQILLRHSVEA